MRPRRRVEPGQAVAARRAPRRDRERETREVGRGDLGSGVVVEMDVVVLRPAAVHDARRLAARAACPLVRRRLRHPRRDERAERPRGVVDPRHAREAGVDDDPHPRHGQRALRDGRRQDDPAAPPRRSARSCSAPDCRPNNGRTSTPSAAAVAHRAGDDLDLPFAGQEDEDVAVGLGERAAHDVADMIEHPRVDPGTGQQRQRRGRRHPHDVDAERRRPARDRRRGSVGVAQHAGHRGGVGGGRRRDEREVVAQVGPDVDAEREREVGVEVPLVVLVDDDRPDARQLRVTVEQLDEQTGRDDLDARRRPAHAFAPHGEAHASTGLLAHERGQPVRRRAGGEPPRFGHQHPALDGVRERERQQRGLARTGRGDQHRGAAIADRGDDLRQHRTHREVGPHHVGTREHHGLTVTIIPGGTRSARRRAR